jgi:hypothetical protein
MRTAYVITRDHLIDYSFGLIYEPMTAQNIVKKLECPDYYWSYRKANDWDLGRFKQN